MKLEERSFETEDGDEFTFRFDIEGLIAVENCANGDSGNANLQQILTGAANGRLGYLRALVFGGLQARHPRITPAQAAALIETDGKALGEALWPALFAALPQEDKAANPRRAAKSGTGSRSSPPGSKKASPRSGSGNRRRGGSPLS